MDLESLKIDRNRTKRPRGRRSRWPARIVVLCVLAGAVVFAWPLLTRTYDQLSLPSVRTYRVTEAAPAAAAAVRGTAANGYVVARRRAALSSDVPGRIVEMNVQEGSVVSEGDVVARLFADDFRAAFERTVSQHEAATGAVQQAERQLAAVGAERTQNEAAQQAASARRDEAAALSSFAELEVGRARDLQESGIEGIRRRQQAESERDAAQARLTAAEADLRTAEAAVTAVVARQKVAESAVEVARAELRAAAAARDQARATLDKTDVRAPFDGVVVLKDAEVGEVVSPNAQGGSNARGAVCTMVDFDSLEVQADVPETTLPSVRLGAPADCFLDAYPDDRYPGVVDRIWPTADRQKATVEVRIALQQRDERLRPEMGVRIVFRSEDQPEPDDDLASTERHILVPSEALVQVGGRTGAFVLERDTVRFTEVTAGERRQNRVAIEAGLDVDQQIVLDPPASLRDGDRVRLDK